MPAAENEITVGTTVQSSTPWAYAVYQPAAVCGPRTPEMAVPVPPEDNGDMVGNEVAYAIDLQDRRRQLENRCGRNVKGNNIRL